MVRVKRLMGSGIQIGTNVSQIPKASALNPPEEKERECVWKLAVLNAFWDPVPVKRLKNKARKDSLDHTLNPFFR